MAPDIRTCFDYYKKLDMKQKGVDSMVSINAKELEMFLKDSMLLSTGRISKSELPRVVGNVQTRKDVANELCYEEFVVRLTI